MLAPRFLCLQVSAPSVPGDPQPLAALGGAAVPAGAVMLDDGRLAAADRRGHDAAGGVDGVLPGLGIRLP